MRQIVQVKSSSQGNGETHQRAKYTLSLLRVNVDQHWNVLV